MNYLSKIFQSVVRTKSAWDEAFLKNIDMGENEVVTKNPYSKSAITYICVSTTARAIAQVPLKIYKPTTQMSKERFYEAKREACAPNHRSRKDILGRMIKGGDLEPVEANHPFQELLDNPNPLMDGYHFKESLIGFLMLGGNVWVVPMAPGSAIPETLWVVNVKSMKPVRDKATGQLSIGHTTRQELARQLNFRLKI